jgi:predicted nucleic acid-binding protein
MRTRIVVDASLWVSSFASDDVHYGTSRSWMEKYVANNGLFAAPSIVFIEVAAAISRRTGDSQLAKQVVRNLKQSRIISTLEIISLKSNLIQAAVIIAADLHLRAADAIYVAVARQLSIPLISWDREQVQKAGTLVAAFTPDTFPFV